MGALAGTGLYIATGIATGSDVCSVRWARITSVLLPSVLDFTAPQIFRLVLVSQIVELVGGGVKLGVGLGFVVGVAVHLRLAHGAGEVLLQLRDALGTLVEADEEVCHRDVGDEEEAGGEKEAGPKGDQGDDVGQHLVGYVTVKAGWEN